jgi:uncharacterized membrane protein YjgN (DUF898 family)
VFFLFLLLFAGGDMNDQVTVPSIALPNRVSFFDRRPDFRRMVVRGAWLEFVTVGFYRFWLATDMRRHLWSHTSVDGDAAEYTGTAKELLLGFLFALAILAPIYLAYFLIGLEAERWKAFASTPLAIFYYVFFQFAIYRARRYRMTRTVWRGVRFWMGGSGLSYAWRVVLWSLFATITLGIALPWRQAALERFKMKHTFYGDLPGHFAATGGALFRRGWHLWLAIAVLWGVLLAAGGTQSSGLVAAAFGLDFLILPFIYGAYKAIEWRWWVSGIRFGDVSFESDLGDAAMIGLYWKVIGWGFLLIIALSIWISAVVGIAYGLYSSNGAASEKLLLISQQLPVLIGFGVGYIVMILLSWMVMRIYLIHDVWKRVADSATVHNVVAAQNVTTQGSTVGALGEGFAGSLDMGF